MGQLINIDHGGTLTDVCEIDGDKMLHTQTLTTPYDLSRCFLAGLRKAACLIDGDENRLDELMLSTDHIRYSPTQGTNAIVERKGPQLGLISSPALDLTVLEAAAAEGLRARPEMKASDDPATTGDEIRSIVAGARPNDTHDRGEVATL